MENIKLTQAELNSWKQFSSSALNGYFGKEMQDKLTNILEENTLKSFPIVNCCNPSGKCNCSTYSEINECKYSC